MKNLYTLGQKLNGILLIINGFLLQSYLIRFKIGNIPTNLLEIFILLQLFIFILTIDSKAKLKLVFKKVLTLKIIVIIIGLTLFSLINLWLKEIDILALIRHLKFIAYAVLYTTLFFLSLEEENERTRVFYIMGIGAVVFGVFSLIYNIFGYNQTWDGRILGPLDSAVYLAYFSAPFFLYFTLTLIGRREKTTQSAVIPHDFGDAESPCESNEIPAFAGMTKDPVMTKDITYLSLAIISGMILFGTRSFGAIGSSFIVIVGFTLWKFKSKFIQNKKILMCIMISAIFLTTAIFYAKIIPTLQTKYSSLDERGQIWQTSLFMLKDPKTFFFGVGLGQFEQNYIKNVRIVLDGGEPLDYYVIQPHNIFFLFWFHFGILGVIFILAYYIKLILKIAQQKNKQITLEVISGFIAFYFLIHGLIDTPLFKNDLLILFLLIIQLAFFKNPQPTLSKPSQDQ